LNSDRFGFWHRAESILGPLLQVSSLGRTDRQAVQCSQLEY
jgi:hypothetical protein